MGDERYKRARVVHPQHGDSAIEEATNPAEPPTRQCYQCGRTAPEIMAPLKRGFPPPFNSRYVSMARSHAFRSGCTPEPARLRASLVRERAGTRPRTQVAPAPSRVRMYRDVHTRARAPVYTQA